MKTPDELRELRGLVEKMTEGPWHSDDRFEGITDKHGEWMAEVHFATDQPGIVALRNSALELLDDLEGARAVLKEHAFCSVDDAAGVPCGDCPGCRAAALLATEGTPSQSEGS